ncbi:YcxB family protein [Micromonospora sp. URMC 103]|uniref:YcxB family protein n=1 Tax=Micromonospora sp. URMC 103 TaxID=3423406 RepID=UPI003F1AC690
MMIDFETQPDRPLLTAALRRALRRSLRLFTICGLILLLPMAMAIALGDRVMAVVWLAAAVFFLILSPPVVRSAVEANWKTYGQRIAWRISDEGVGMASPLMDSLIRWAALESVEPIPGQLLLKINRQHVIPLPIGGLTPSDRDTLLAFLRGRGLLPGDDQSTRAAIAG